MNRLSSGCKALSAHRTGLPGVAIGVAILYLAACSIWLLLRAEQPEEFFLRLFDRLTAWPVVVFTLVVLFLTRFESGVAAILTSLATRAWKGRLGPGEFQVDAVAQSPDSSGLQPGNEVDRVDELPLPEVASGPSALPELGAAVWFWHYEYLNQLLRPHTQSVLAFFAGTPVPIAASALDSLVLPFHDFERRNVLNALFVNDLLTGDGAGSVLVTDKGARFLNHQRRMGRHVEDSAAPAPFNRPPVLPPLPPLPPS